MTRLPRILTLLAALGALVLSSAHAAQPGEKLSRMPEYYLGPPLDSGPVKVRAAFHLQNLNRIDDEAENFQFSGVFKLTWKDKRQAFDPAEAGIAEKVYQGDFQADELSPAWYPQIFLLNEAAALEKRGVLLRIQPDGTTTLIQSVSAVAQSALSMRRYPFDKHRLEAKFAVLGFDADEVLLEADDTPPVAPGRRVEVTQWEVSDVSVTSKLQPGICFITCDSVSTFEVAVEVHRQSFFVLRLVVIPLALIVVLSWSVFWMDRASLGDRINVSFVGILTAVAYQIVVSDILPHISYMTLVNGFVNISFFLMSATVVVNLAVGVCDKRGRTELGDAVDFRCRWIFPAIYVGLLALITAIALVFF